MTVPAGWELGPFVRPPDAAPVSRPDPAAGFDCPMRGRPVRWEATHTFNPAAVVRDGRVWLLYRAEDDIGRGIGGYTSRLGLAVSEDGIRFGRRPGPVLYPADDNQRALEWEGGCEDPRIIETEEGGYLLFYTQYQRAPGGHPWKTVLGLAASDDLVNWTKLGTVTGRDADGQPVTPIKSASLVCAVRGGRLVAARIDGRYWLYYGEGFIRLLTTEDFRLWSPVPDFILLPRPGRFDSAMAECGPPAVLTERGVVLLYNGKNSSGADTDPALFPGMYANGQALFDAQDPTRLLARPEQPFFQPALSWEATGQYAAGTTFIEGLVLFGDRWLLYYGCADSYVAVATAAVKPGEADLPATA